MFWNLYGTYTLVITLFSIIKYTSNSPLHSRDYVNSIDHSKFDNINNEDLLVHDVLPYFPASVEPSSSSSSSSSLLLPTIGSVSSSISSIPNEEEILRLQLALALQVDSEVNKAIHLENAANETIQKADLLNKAADEAKYRAQLVGQILNSLKQSWNTTTTNDNDNNIIDNFSNDDNIHEKRAFIEVPKINQDYLLDEEVGGQIITDYNDNNREKRNQEHRGHHHQHQQRQRYNNMKKKRNIFPVPDPHNELYVQHLYDYPFHEYIDDVDDDDDNKNIILNDSEQNIKKQLTLEKIRLLILRQLIKQQRESKEKEQEKEQKEIKDHEQHHLHHYDHSHDNNHNDYLQLDKNIIPLHMINQYPNLYIDRQTWKELHNQYDNDPIDDKQINLDINNDNNYEKNHYEIKDHLWKRSDLNSLDNDDSILFK
ncbi:unnamed protein product [Schistosoma margrebowiei]|uniref:Uncharacterized protein n=1 Tax=Schistosoma margrebowiei TaxID=48269 RepID=A0A183LN04_9TREM|nr:unnamed protein product [Schistosoma margrebowiei]